MEAYEVAIIGGGPTGLAAALRLRELGMAGVVVLERDSRVGGIPQHCGHLGFGWESHRRFWTGSRFTAQLRADAADLELRTGCTVLRLQPDGRLEVRDDRGVSALSAKRVMVCTGARESTAAARAIGGNRLGGVMNTGALQQHVYLHRHLPFKRPIILGSEWVSFSAILTCRHLGAHPVALLEEQPRTVAPWPGALVSRICFGVPVLTRTRLVAIEGRAEVESTLVECAGRTRSIPCDGVVVSGQFRPENALFAQGELALRTLSPRVDSAFQCSNPVYFAAGNVLAPLKRSGQCWQQGRTAAEAVFRSLR